MNKEIGTDRNDSEEKAVLRAALRVASAGMPDEAVALIQAWLACRAPAAPSEDHHDAEICKQAADAFLRIALDAMAALCSAEEVIATDALWKASSVIWIARTREWEDASLPF